MATTVGELHELLDDYGDHLPVVIIITGDGEEKAYADFTVDTSQPQGNPEVNLVIG